MSLVPKLVRSKHNHDSALIHRAIIQGSLLDPLFTNFSTEYIMAIYSLSHDSVGRTSHEKFTSAGHINYITRESAATETLAHHMPVDRHKACLWIKDQEVNDRANARVIDKVMIALPIELTHDQHLDLVNDFCQVITQGDCPWFAVIHAKGKDVGNPHAHIVLRDRSVNEIQAGVNRPRRVMHTSQLKSTEMIREVWEHRANAHLAMHGHDVRIDRRSLKEQGVERKPGIHVGPKSNVLSAQNKKPQSHDRTYTVVGVKGIKGGQQKRKVRYATMIDKGLSRNQFNENIIDLNLEKMRRSNNYATRLKAEYELEQRQKDRKLHLKKDDINRRYKQARGLLWKDYEKVRSNLQKSRQTEKDNHYANIKATFKPVWADHFARKDNDLKYFYKREKELLGRLINITRSLGHVWTLPTTEGDKAHGSLSRLFNAVVNKEERFKNLKAAYRVEEHMIYEELTDQMACVRRFLKRKYGPTMKTVKDQWEAQKSDLRSDGRLEWHDYNKTARQREREKEFERENLEGYIKDFYNRTNDGVRETPDISTTQDNGREPPFDKSGKQKNKGRIRDDDQDLGYG